MNQYSDIESLSDDKLFLSRAEECEISDELDILIQKAKRIIRECYPNEAYTYSLPEKGHRCNVKLIQNDAIKYIISFPDNTIKNDLREITRIKEALGLNRELIVYEEDGFCIMQIADEVIDWNRSIIVDCIKKLRQMHNSNLSINRAFVNNYRILEKKFRDSITDAKITELFGWDVSAWIDTEIMTYLNKYKPVLCHGDASYGNVLLFNNKAEWIDWELLQMSNPMFDIFYFFESLYSGNMMSEQMSIQDFLHVYYEDRNLSSKEKMNVICMGIYFLYWRILNNAKSGIIDEETIRVINRMKLFWQKKKFDAIYKYYMGDD